VLLLVLVAYADWTPATFRHALGTATAVAFAVLYSFGHLIDTEMPLQNRSVDDNGIIHGNRWLSGWPVPTQPTDTVAPDPYGGAHLVLAWGIAAVIVLIVLVALNPETRKPPHWRRRDRETPAESSASRAG
jgi:hypothetical protein